ncbi:MAG: hypothetical protein P4L51_23695 [Puia sp.]|nr:hypothetical protein [Puia sp.]
MNPRIKKATIEAAQSVSRTPDRVLHNIPLFDEQEIAPSIFYGIDHRGFARLYDFEWFLGYAGPPDSPPYSKYVVSIFGKLSPRRSWKRAKYACQTSANGALLERGLALCAKLAARRT